MLPNDSLQAALRLLLQAHDYSLGHGYKAWDFAVEIASLRTAGLSNNDLRWLIYQGYLAQAVETTGPQDDHRSFKPGGRIVLADAACFILTDPGVKYARSVTNGAVDTMTPCPKRLASGNGVPVAELPFWDKDRRTLRFRNFPVKQFKVPAPNQEIILAAFQEEDWSARIDDPLPHRADIDPKRRLHDSINSLNRNQKQLLLHFSGDGTGEAVCWEPARNGAACTDDERADP
jgi:hypothetical protein